MAVIHIISLFLFFLSPICLPPISFFFFFNDTATTEIYTLSLHDALPIWSTSPNGATSNAPHAPHLAAARVGTPGWFRAVCDDGRESRHVVPRDAGRAQPAAARAQGRADRVRPRLPGGDLRDVRHGDQRPPARAAARHHDVSAAHALVPGRRRAVDRAVAGRCIPGDQGPG